MAIALIDDDDMQGGVGETVEGAFVHVFYCDEVSAFLTPPVFPPFLQVMTQKTLAMKTATQTGR
jgi:hypothetical protein